MINRLTVKQGLNVALFIFNIGNALGALLSIFICGLTLVALKTGSAYMLGFYTYAAYSIEQLFKETSMMPYFAVAPATITLLVASCLVFISSIFGLLILIRPSKKLALWHVHFVIFNAIALLAMGYASLVANHHIQMSLRQKLITLQNRIAIVENTWMNYPGELFIDMQSTWQCCGVANGHEWLTNVPWFQAKYSQFARHTNDNGIVFPGCTWYEAVDCAVQDEQGFVVPISTMDCIRVPIYAIYPRGCSDVIKNEIGRCLSVFTGIAFGYAFFQAVGIAIYCLFIRHVSASRNEPLCGPQTCEDTKPQPVCPPYYISSSDITTSTTGFPAPSYLPPIGPAHRIDVTTQEGQAELAALCAAVIKSTSKF